MNKNSLIPTQKELDENLKYEINMVKNTCRVWMNMKKELNQFGKNCLVESLALHARVLISFFYGDKEKYHDDIIAQDFLSESIEWANIRPEMSYFLKETKLKADYRRCIDLQVQHLLKVIRGESDSYIPFRIKL